MSSYNSPWIHQLSRKRPIAHLGDIGKADIAVIGAGISGISTAFFLAEETNKHILLIDSGKVAHGASGHNAGQIIASFERPLKSIVDQYGLDMAVAGRLAIESAWQLLDHMVAAAKLETPIAHTTGYMGLGSKEMLLLKLEEAYLMNKKGFRPWQFFVAESANYIQEIPEIYKPFYSIVPFETITSLMETKTRQYHAMYTTRLACANSALLCEEIVGYLMAKYPHRFTLAEETPVKKVTVNHDGATLHIGTLEVTVDHVVMCTNGFENIDIINHKGTDINTYFHQTVSGQVGYMTAYLEPLSRPPVGISFLRNELEGKNHQVDPYFYLTRRPFEIEKNEQHNLICIGGPETELSNTRSFTYDKEYIPGAHEDIDAFLKKTYVHAEETIAYKYKWHGLMGYTKTGIRLIGPEPHNPHVMYNLGCNGVGILPAIYGGKKIADFVNNRVHEASIFDPVPFHGSLPFKRV